MAGSVSDYFNVMEQNEALREENAELRQWMAEALELREVVASYEALDGYMTPPDAQPINAFVIGEANDAFARSMIVNAGRSNNVEIGQAVVDADGLVGRIVEAGRGAARVLLLTDIQSRVPVYVEGADVEGILVGNTRARPAISFTASAEEAEAAPGQRVLTSGAGGALPRGLPVGVVSGESRDGIIVDLYANYARTRMVRVINYAFPEIEPETEEEAAAPADENGEAAAPAEG
jgi:rod shape-determining protein MreC